MRTPKRAPVYYEDRIELTLSRGFVTVVDLDCPIEILSRTWYATKYCKPYAVTNTNSTVVPLHRMLLGDAANGLDVDHIDGDRLNNRLSNLRPCNRRQNLANIGARVGRYRGVHWDRKRRKWVARLTSHNGVKAVCTYIGRFDNELDAARAWDAAALASGLYDPKFLRLNFPIE